jgi:hypothetical protein
MSQSIVKEGSVVPDDYLVKIASSWMRSSKMTGSAMLAVSKKALFIIGKDGDPYKWVCFWDPTTHSVLGGTGVVRFYDWEAMPSRLRKSVRQTFKQWRTQTQLDD